jgi:hypothetical protein
MDAAVFLVAFASGGALLAAWGDARFASRRPESLQVRLVHTVAAFVGLQLGGYAVASLCGADAPLPQRLSVLLLLFLPSLVYAFLSGFWLLRTLAEVAPSARR